MPNSIWQASCSSVPDRPAQSSEQNLVSCAFTRDWILLWCIGDGLRNGAADSPTLTRSDAQPLGKINSWRYRKAAFLLPEGYGSGTAQARPRRTVCRAAAFTAARGAYPLRDRRNALLFADELADGGNKRLDPVAKLINSQIGLLG